MTQHPWTESDDLIALYLYRHGSAPLGLSLQHIAATLGISPASLRMRCQNMKAIDTGAGLRNYARQSRVVYERHRATSEGELRRLVLGVLLECGSKLPHSKGHRA
jgi:hypothetical protein